MKKFWILLTVFIIISCIVYGNILAVLGWIAVLLYEIENLIKEENG